MNQESSLYIMNTLAHKKSPYPTGLTLFHETCFNKRSGAVVMFPDSEGLGAAVEAGVDSSLTQPSSISYFSLYTLF